jgi:hypothetical protein
MAIMIQKKTKERKIQPNLHANALYKRFGFFNNTGKTDKTIVHKIDSLKT